MAYLFETTTLSEHDIRSMLHLRGGLPVEHRVTAWKFLLRLPGNSKQFAQLVSRGPHPTALASLSIRYPLRDRKLFRKAAVLLSALAHWSPILAEVEFVPSWLFPFCVVFGQDDLGAFEAAVSFFLHWGSRLLVTFPQPPVPVLAGMELALQRADRELAAHLKSLSVGALSYGWPLLRSAFSEVLAREEWLCLIDRILANAHQPELLEAAVVGFVVSFRKQLLVLESTEETEAFFRRRQSPSTSDLQRMFRVMEKVSSYVQRPERLGGPVDSGGADVGEAMAALALLRIAPQEFKPLPRVGPYPFFDGYPQFVINYQAEMRQRVAAQERDMRHKYRLVKELRQGAGAIASREGAPKWAEDTVEKLVEA
ncbi:unnamed protein product [Ectocarpus sp. 6 AP-2014]